jgi:hypothetical protein
MHDIISASVPLLLVLHGRGGEGGEGGGGYGKKKGMEKRSRKGTEKKKS